MASVLKVDKLDPQSGTALEIGTSGDTLNVPSGVTLDINSGATLDATGATVTGAIGKVLQVVQGKSTTATDTTSTSYVATNLSASITPSSTSSKIFILAQGCGDTDAATRQLDATFYRDSTNLIGGSQQSFTALYSGDRLICSVVGNYLDSPSSTSSLTYAVYIKTPTGANVEFISQATEAHITLMEIGA